MIEQHLALILFLPWFAILGTLYWLYPQAPRTAARRWFDGCSLLLAMLAAVAGLRWGMASALDGQAHAIWRQVLSTLLVYGLFLLLLAMACVIRWRCFRSSRAGD